MAAVGEHIPDAAYTVVDECPQVAGAEKDIFDQRQQQRHHRPHQRVALGQDRHQQQIAGDRRIPQHTENEREQQQTLHAQPAERAKIDERLRESQEKRRTTQPVAKSAGCIFKNPNSIPAGKLVDELGLKNLRVGNARVSEVHGNFIVNDGGATATEMLELIDRIKQTAKTKRGIELETEVQIVGEPRS